MAGVPDTDRYKAYAPVASTGPFSVPWTVYGDPNTPSFEVRLDGEIVDPDDFTFSGTTNNAVSPAQTTAGSITFDSAITGTLEIEGDRPPQRISVFTEGVGVPAKSHNAILDAAIATQREIWQRQSRALRIGYSDFSGGADPVIPTLQAGRGLIVNAGGTGFDFGKDSGLVADIAAEAAARAAADDLLSAAITAAVNAEALARAAADVILQNQILALTLSELPDPSVIATGTTANRTFADRFADVKRLVDFKDSTDPDYSLAFSRARTYAEASAAGIVLVLPEGVVEVSEEVDYEDLTKPIFLRGAGKLQTVLYGNFTGAGDAVLNIGFSDNANRIQGVGCEEFTICANGVEGDPMGIKAMRSQQHSIRRMHFPGDGDTIAGGVRKLLNTALMATQVNNSDFTECTFKAGYQPVAYSTVTSTVRATVNAASTTCELSESIAVGVWANEIIIFDDGGASGDATDYWWTTIASVTDGDTIELADAPPENIVSQRFCVGFVQVASGGIGAGTTTLNLHSDVPGFGSNPSDFVGMRINIPLGRTVADAGDSRGMFSTYIASVTDTDTCELAHAIDETVAAGTPVIFCPNVFVGKTMEEDAETRQTNDCNFNFCQFEGGQGAGIVINQAITLYLRACKIEMESMAGSGNQASRAAFPIIASEVKHVVWLGGALNFGWLPGKGHIWIMGSRGTFELANASVHGLLPDNKIAYIEEVDDRFRFVHGTIFVDDGLKKHSAGWLPFRTPAARNHMIVAKGPIINRHDDAGQEFSGQAKAGGFTSTDGRPDMADGTVIGFKPAGTQGVISVATGADGGCALFEFRTSDHASGGLIQRLTTNVDAATEKMAAHGSEAIPNGSTGSANRLTLFAGTDGLLYLENQLGFTTRPQWTFLGLGT